MKSLLKKAANRVAPRAVSNLRVLSSLDTQFDQGPARFIEYELELRALRRDIDELRRDNRRVAELYDVVFERARRDAAAAGVTPPADPAVTVVARLADELIDERADADGAAGTGGQAHPAT